MLLESHAPLDLVVIMLGTNDVQSHRKLTAREAALGCGALISIVQKSMAGTSGKSPQVLLLSPPVLSIPTN